MRKYQFLQELREGLSSLQESEKLAACSFYSELIDDRIDEGMTEEEAVADLGDIAQLAEQVLTEGTPEAETEDTVSQETAAEPDKTTRKGGPITALWIVLIVLGFPVWFSLAITAIALVFSLIVTFWSLILALAAVALAVPLAGLALLFSPQYGLAGVGIGLCCIGVGIFIIIGIVYLIKYAIKGTGWAFRTLFKRKNYQGEHNR